MTHHAQPLAMPAWEAAPTVPLIESLGRPEFSDTLLHAISQVVQADFCSAFRIVTGPAVTCLLAAGGLDAVAARRSAERYAAGYWRHDPAFLAADGAGAALLRLPWDAIRHEAFRTECYVAPKVVERLSVIGPASGGRLLLSIFRRRSTGFFTDGEAARWADVAPVFAALAAKHGALLEAGVPSVDGLGLSARERDVASRLAGGDTLKAAGRELGLALSTVETFRKRLYRKLGVRNRVELLARLNRRH